MWLITVVVGLESLVLLFIAVTFLIGLFNAAANSLSGAIFLTIMLFALGVALAAVALQHFRGYRWTRAAALVWQLLMLAIAVTTLLNGQIWLGLSLLIPPLAVLVLLFTPRVVAFTLRQGDSGAL
ncbi:hypothetical protein UM93_07690 [Psychromicrobium lacuslunae]|uniref:Uncharacterized protein n=1 Tax=Psychromicrobium lacuslunae TaxID=1618207 RepID=A0A0D4BYM5_9MICC|nr:hypothetical protein UM93_07690 [Psychromicrobium lacuslunae]